MKEIIDAEKFEVMMRNDFTTNKALETLLDGVCDMREIVEYRKKEGLPYYDMRLLISKQLSVAFQLGIQAGFNAPRKAG